MIVGVELFVIAEDVVNELGASGAVVSIVMEIEDGLEVLFSESEALTIKE